MEKQKLLITQKLKESNNSDDKKILSYSLSPLTGKIKQFSYIGFDVETYKNKENTHTFYSGGLYFKELNEYWYYCIDEHKKVCESLNKLHNTKFIYKGNKEKFCNDIMNMIDKNKHLFFSGSKYIVATNLAFDFSVLFHGTKYWNEFNTIFSSSKLLLAEHKINKRRSIKFMDTMNFMPASVESLGKILNIPKIKKPEFLGEKPVTFDDKKELLYYNFIDSKISGEFLYFIQKATNMHGGNIKLTVSASALDMWRRNFLKHALNELKDKTLKELDKQLEMNDISLSNYSKELKKVNSFYSRLTKEEFYQDDNFNIRDFIFDGYYGGRTEAFARGYFNNKTCKNKKGLYYYDINSLYPAVMEKNEYPFPNSVLKIKSKDYNLLYFNILNKFGVSKVKVKSNGSNYPILPKKINTKLCFPNGVFYGTYNHNELKYAVDNGYEILEIYDQIIYTKTWKPFKKYVNDLYALRLKYKEQKSPFEKVVKLYLNSLYGKFAQHYIEDTKIIDLLQMTKEQRFKFMSDLSKQNMSDNVSIKDNNVIFSQKIDCESKFSFPILASYTTSYARILMHQYLIKYNPVYMDTDSIMTEIEIKKTSQKLGDMKLEAFIENGIIVKPKMYSISEKQYLNLKINNEIKCKVITNPDYNTFKNLIKGFDVKCKGITKPDYNTFKNLINGVGVKRLKFSKLKESIRRGINPNTVFELEKHLDLEDNKRDWDNKTFPMFSIQYSKPLFFDEDKHNKIKQEKEREKQIKKEAKLKKFMSNYDEFLKSDCFDNHSVGSDISDIEFLKNEMFFDGM